MKVWVSKYALSDGIKEMDGMELSVSDDGRRKYVTMGMYFFYLGKEAHETPEAARAAAEKMRQRKIASIRAQIERLETLTF